jgi:transposase InsO family protein
MMSSLKYQLKVLVSSLSAEANQSRDREVKKRFYLIKAVVESKKDVKKTCEMRGFSTDFFYAWAKRFIEFRSLLGLKSQSKSPKTFWNKTSKRIERKIIRLRQAEPFKGPERISFDLKRKFKIVCAVSTVAAILKRKGLVTKEYRDRLTKKHMKRYRRPWPGHLQMDHKYTPYLIEGRQCYQLSVVDHHSSWRMIRTYKDRTIKSVMEFLNELERVCPFEIIQIQTDNATEFTDKFSSQKGIMPSFDHAMDVWCRERRIHHKLIPVGEKELNGKVENTHKFDDREFYSQIEVYTLNELKTATLEWNQRWNEERPTKTLGWKTPNEVLSDACVRAYAYLKLLLPAKAWQPVRGVKKLSTEHATIYATTEGFKQIHEKAKKPKKPSAIDRYLQYLDWEEKQKLKSWLPVPVILQNFSKN